VISVFDQPRPLPEIIFADGDGHALSLADFRGRVVLLNIWATWCVPCRKEMPTLDRLQATLGGDQFIVIALSMDREGVPAVKRFYDGLGVSSLGIYVDPSSRVSHALAVPGVPTTLLIDRQGREVARKLGEAEWDGPAMIRLIRQTINAGSTSPRSEAR
jgi:thiol-disulfide isomerase/thioredoxin